MPDATPLFPVAKSLTLILAEATGLVDRVAGSNVADALDCAAVKIASASRIFVAGAGRSGVALNGTAMRLMHLGLTVHVVGWITSPAIGAGDLLLVASGSGTTTGIVKAAETASRVGADIVALTATETSPLAELATVLVVLPAAQKQDHGGSASGQYAGGLFEQAVALTGDAIFHSLWLRSGESAEELWTRHANIE